MHSLHNGNSRQVAPADRAGCLSSSSYLIGAIGGCLLAAIPLAPGISGATTPIEPITPNVRVVQTRAPHRHIGREVAQSFLGAATLFEGHWISPELGEVRGHPLLAHQHVAQSLEGGDPVVFLQGQPPRPGGAFGYVDSLLEQAGKTGQVTESIASVVNVPDPAATELLAEQAPAARHGARILTAIGRNLNLTKMVRMMRERRLTIDERGGDLVYGPIIAGRIQLVGGQSFGFAKLLDIHPVHGPQMQAPPNQRQPAAVSGVRVWARNPKKWISERHELFEVVGWDILFEEVGDPTNAFLRPFRSEQDVILPGEPVRENTFWQQF